jgi:hypothetical protein
MKITHDPPDGNVELMQSFVFPAKSHLFSSSSSSSTQSTVLPSHGPFVVLAIKIDETARMQVLSVGGDSVVQLGICDLNVDPSVGLLFYIFGFLS